MSIFTYGPRHRWFAWRPTWTDCGWRWLCTLTRYRCYVDVNDAPAFWVDEARP